ncbi:MAG: MBL fold metallo-hydrolase [Planctomycetota bacterium]|nr:MBL fold metallo-hydrolase [Planctomycetota bacterium]
MKVTFLGGVGTVTGSKYLVQEGETKILVDCGLFQGVKSLRQRNWNPPPIDGALSGVVLTHAHIDHSGYLPALVRDGFHGPIFATAPTQRLCKILLPDSGYLQEEQARYANKKGFARHSKAEPLYTKADAEAVSPSFRTTVFGEDVKIGQLTLRFQAAGHILGAASILIRGKGKSVLFSGDLGRPEDILMPAPDNPGRPDWVIMESTYGNRRHKSNNVLEDIARIVRQIAERRGVLLIPAFAVGRAQVLLYILHQIFENKLAPRLSVALNSPMATNVTKLYQDHCDNHRLSLNECASMCDLPTYVTSVEDSRALNKKKGPRIIISASGMLTGGRVLHHFEAFAPSKENGILLSGFQAPGTRGHSLAMGASEIKVHGKYIPVKAEVFQTDAISAHADQTELLNWLDSIEKRPKGVYLVHGEPAASDELRRRIEESMQFRVRIPRLGEILDADA